MGVELLARLERDGVHPALGVGQLHPLARLEGPRPRCCSRRSIARVAHAGGFRFSSRAKSAVARMPARRAVGGRPPGTRGPGAAHAVEQFRRRSMSTREDQPGARAGGRPRPPGSRAGAVGGTALISASSTIAAGPLGGIDQTMPAGACPPRPAAAPRRPAGPRHEQARAEQVARRAASGSALLISATRQACARAEPQVDAPATAWTTSPWPPRPTCGRHDQARDAISDGHAPGPHQPATRVPVSACRRAPDRRPQQAAAVERQAGQQVEHREDRLLQASSRNRTSASEPCGQWRRGRRTPRRRRRADTNGPAAAIEQLVAGPAGLTVDLGHPAEQEHVIRRDRQYPRARLTTVCPSSWARCTGRTAGRSPTTPGRRRCERRPGTASRTMGP